MKDKSNILKKAELEWISVKEQGYPDEYFENPYHHCYLIIDDHDFIMLKNWKGSYFEGEHVSDEPKVVYWTLFKTPDGELY